MNVKDFALLLTCFQTTWSNIVATKLPKPENVSLLTLNTQYILTWNMPTTVMDSTVTFTTEYQAKYKFDKKKKDWTQVCVRSPETRCDLTGQPLHYLGMYVIRVRASTENLNSDWVFKSFCPDSDAKLGPPSRVALAPVGNLLEVAISGPLDSKGESMKEHVPFLSYRLHYWSRSADPQGLSPMEVNTGTTQVTLQELEAWTWYCVRVQSRYDYYNKTSLYSPAQCMQTEGDIPYWQISLYFLASLVIFFLLVLLPSYLGFRCYMVLKSTFYPSIQLPPHIHEYLCDSSSGSDIPRLLTPESESELVCDKLSLCPEAVLLEIQTPPPSLSPGLLTDPSEQEGDRHSRQLSGDSGMYSSTEGGSTSALSRGNSSGPPTRVAMYDSCHALPFPEQLKMAKMAGEPADQGLMDEGVIVDMCV